MQAENKHKVQQARLNTLIQHFSSANRSLYDKSTLNNASQALHFFLWFIRAYYCAGILLFAPAIRLSELGYLRPLYTPHFNDIMLGLFISFVAGGLIFVPILLLPTTILALICYSIFWQRLFWRNVFVLIYQTWCFIIWAYLVSFICFCIMHLFYIAEH